ncbi:MAG TPA: FHA domain-containing protein [Chloroflexota bacterium]|nr:FHA domain-containing protein [Chloroflexota bacterium]
MASPAQDQPESRPPADGRTTPAALVGEGALGNQRFSLARDLTLIGRAEDCDIYVRDPLASRRHAQVRREPWRYVLEDLGSRNGTLVNGVPITQPHHLQNGDLIMIATSPLRFEDPNATIPMTRDSLRLAHLPVWVNAAAGEAHAFGKRLDLAPKEFSLLALLYERAGEVCEKDEIAHAVWPEYSGAVSDYNIETLVSRLRNKLEQGGAGADAIVTVKKRGYRLRARV